MGAPVGLWEGEIWVLPGHTRFTVQGLGVPLKALGFRVGFTGLGRFGV